MKKFMLLSLSLLTARLSHGQATEVSLHLTSGFSAFRGAAATDETTLTVPASELDPAFGYISPRLVVPYANNPFGRTLGLSYGAAVQVQHISATNTVFGLQAGYEVLRSRTPIFAVFNKYDFGTPVKGHATLTNRFINWYPFLGHRFTRGGLDYDVTLGPEIGLLQRSHETSEATTGKPSAEKFTTDLDRSQRKVDVRARVSATAYYHRLGFSLGYSLGLSKYRQDYASSVDELYSHVFRTNVSYRLGI